MKFYPENARVPEYLQSDGFVLEPLTPAHVALDYAALMSSKVMLRLWSGSPWPSDDFTLDDNQEDLAWHWQEHQECIAFTFTVLNPAKDTCLGCVYIKSMLELIENNEAWETAVSDYSALVRFWVTQSYLTQELDKTLLQTLDQWFTDSWAFNQLYWHTPVNNRQQIDLFQDNGRQLVDRILLPNRGGYHFLFQ